MFPISTKFHENLFYSSAGSRITRTVSAGSHFSWTVVLAGSKRSCTVSGEAKYDGQSLQEAKISGLVYSLCSIGIWFSVCSCICPSVFGTIDPTVWVCFSLAITVEIIKPYTS